MFKKHNIGEITIVYWQPACQ